MAVQNQPLYQHMQFSPVLTVVVGLVRGRTQLSLTNCTTLLPHHIELTMTICKCPQPPTYSQIKIDGNAEAGYKLSHSAAYMDFTFCSASVTGGAGCWEGGLGLSTMVSCLHSSSCKIEIMSLTNSQRITFRCS